MSFECVKRVGENGHPVDSQSDMFVPNTMRDLMPQISTLISALCVEPAYVSYYRRQQQHQAAREVEMLGQ